MKKLTKISKSITNVEDLNEVLSMFETNTKKWEKAVFERGVERGFKLGINLGNKLGKLEDAEKMVQLGLSTSDIRKIMGFPISRTEQLRRKRKRR